MTSIPSPISAFIDATNAGDSDAFVGLSCTVGAQRVTSGVRGFPEVF